jgi:hypothetical protein
MHTNQHNLQFGVQCAVHQSVVKPYNMLQDNYKHVTFTCPLKDHQVATA